MNVLKKLIKILTNLKAKDFLLLLITISLLKIAFFETKIIIREFYPTVFVDSYGNFQVTGNIDADITGKVDAYTY